MMSDETYKLALFGNPVSHSLSPKIHNHFATQFDLDIDYKLIKVTDSELAIRVNVFFAQGGLGANITLPHKQNIMPFVEQLSDIAEQSQAVNTLYVNKEKKLFGDNTDGIGFIQDIVNRHGFDFTNSSVLILGAGGATQGIVPVIMQQGIDKLVIANRSIDKAEKLCTYDNSMAVSLSDLECLECKFDLIIHTSSLGHQGQTLKFLPQHIHNKTVAYDLSYGKPAEPFLEYCKCMMLNKIYDGLGMLVEQAACSFELWFGKKPVTDRIYKSIKNK